MLSAKHSAKNQGTNTNFKTVFSLKQIIRSNRKTQYIRGGGQCSPRRGFLICKITGIVNGAKGKQIDILLPGVIEVLI